MGSFLNSTMANGFLSGNWVNPASIMPAITSSFGDIGFLAVAGQGVGGGMNRAMFTGAICTVAMSTAVGPRRFGDRCTRVTRPGRIGGVGRYGPRDAGRDDVGAAQLGRSHARGECPVRGVAVGGLVYAAGGGGDVRDAQECRVCLECRWRAAAARGWGFAAPRYGFRPPSWRIHRRPDSGKELRRGVRPATVGETSQLAPNPTYPSIVSRTGTRTYTRATA